MIIVHVEAAFDPDQAEEIVLGLLDGRAAIEAMEGNLEIRVLTTPTAPDTIELIQFWDSADAFDAYRKSALFAAIGARLVPLMTRPPATRVFDAVETT